MHVRQILKSKGSDRVLTIRPDATVAEAARILSECRIGSLVVSTDGQRVDGIISERDIVREMGKRGVSALDERVEEMMTEKVETCVADDQADDVLTKMTQGRFRHLPVVENEVMIGLISIGDVVKARLSELSMEKDALEGMIAGR
ncbi:Inosine-5'-monophosphate dehydrogenase [Rubellimicrobium mesophilum DSM 19309]|uniref:Inosine-5'-monophosphate dehydrogenase n=1 Tax=Rubellimicrobium mesophilum DSM 19309 TaxID=442562 RepID=A0A017HN63_9RHOB|nr:CBS domain-containing protein [Rubellimicrobium mesophilum]EYD75821.1 Inosine-5'-monophosphate dehydrogenase [Rubellimicrobium mesophilum DSM 19309]